MFTFFSKHAATIVASIVPVAITSAVVQGVRDQIRIHEGHARRAKIKLQQEQDEFCRVLSKAIRAETCEQETDALWMKRHDQRWAKLREASKVFAEDDQPSSRISPK